VRTPNIDRIAEEGIRFTDAHASSSICTPSRYALLTGEYPLRNKGAIGVATGDHSLIIRAGSLTMPQMFRNEGYTTGFVGKWHLGLGRGEIDWNGDILPGPQEVGFDSAFFMPATGDRVPTVLIRGHRVENLDPDDPIRVSYKHKIGNEPTGKDNPELASVLLGNKGHDGSITNGVSRIGWMSGGQSARWTDDELMDDLTADAVQFIHDNSAGPFFLYYAPHGIHEPRVPAKRFVGKSGAGVYGDQIMELDDSVGRLLKALDEREITDDTIVIFTSDNGGSWNDIKTYQYGKRADLRGHRINGDLRGQKYTVWEGGTRVPFVLRWPGKVASGATSSALLSQMDLQASFAALLGVELPEGVAIDSMDVLDAFLGKSPKGRSELLEHQYSNRCALRVDNWKWIPGDEGKEGALYDLTTDLSEEDNLASKMPTKARAMAKRLTELKESLYSD
jgi:arylsulfatase A-like enzyme